VLRKEAAVAVINGKTRLNSQSRGCSEQISPSSPLLSALTGAALMLPGLLYPAAQAAESDSLDFQYSHYQEGKRQITGLSSDEETGEYKIGGIKNAYNPIEVESQHGHANVSLSDRVKFAFNYTQDTWGGATPVATAPAVFGNNREVYSDAGTIAGASPLLTGQNGGKVLFDSNRKPVAYALPGEPDSGLLSSQQLTHVLASASPETRKQGDFKLTHEWNEAALSLGGGISVEDDYESRFGNIGGRWDLNQKLTTLNLDLSYTNSDTHAVLDHDSLPYLDYSHYRANGQLTKTKDSAQSSILSGGRQDWASHFGITQIINKNALMSADIGYTRSTGYLSNPYKAVSVVFIDPLNQNGNLPPGIIQGKLKPLLEQRPEVRNQWNLGGRYVQFINSLDAALHFDYRFSADDWGIHSHTFEADWVQPLGNGWTLTPRVRYYSQSAADFYTPWLVSEQAYRQQPANTGRNPALPYNPNKLPDHFSSDHRLSGFGALSGALTVSKTFGKAVTLETGFEYYTHQGSFKLGGGGENAFADFDYWLANAAVKVNLDTFVGSSHDQHAQHGEHGHHHHGSHAPAGVMFDHLLPKAGDMMVGYRYMYGSQGGTILNGDVAVNDSAIVNRGCGPNPCFLKPASMNMTMHMLDLMYAPTDWLTLMLMPQFMDMSMNMKRLSGAPNDDVANNNIGNSAGSNIGEHIEHHVQNGHETGGIGDLGMYALFKFFDDGTHHFHATAGLSAPTADINIQLRRNHQVEGGFIHYGMQLGNGTWDFKPSLTYTGQLEEFSWGAQVNATVRLEDKNKSGYALGDIFQAMAWSGYNLTDWLSASVRGVYTTQGSINGRFNGLINQFGPMDYPGSYGGKFWDIGFGLSAAIPSGDLAGNRVSVEWLQPVKDDVNGYQLERDGTLSATWSLAF